MTGYIDIFIPLAIGLLGYFNTDIIIKRDNPDYEKKQSLIKKWSLVLIAGGVLYGIMKILGH